jgi:hypothetical protein
MTGGLMVGEVDPSGSWRPLNDGRFPRQPVRQACGQNGSVNPTSDPQSSVNSGHLDL